MKIARHAEILRLIRTYDIETQTDLVRCLNEAGYAATQATVSRDIRELRLSKAPLPNGRVHYVAPEQEIHPEKYRRVLRDSVLSLHPAKNLIVVKTVPGMAMAAAASLDDWNCKKIAGCIAGDDTIFCALAPDADLEDTIRDIEALLS